MSQSSMLATRPWGRQIDLEQKQIWSTFYFLSRGITLWIELPWPANTYTRKHWTAVLTLLGLISSVYCDLRHWRLNQRPQIAEPKFNNWATSPYAQVMPNQLVMVIAWPINLNVSCKLHLYSLQRTWLPPGPRLPKRIRNTHSRNYYNLKGKDTDLHFIFKVEELYCELNYHDQKILKKQIR